MSSNSTTSIIRAVLRECQEKLVEELDSYKIVQDLNSKGILSDEDKKFILLERTKTAQCQKLLTVLEASRNDEILDILIEQLRSEDEQPHLWTLLEYSKAKQRKIKSSLHSVSESHHM